MKAKYDEEVAVAEGEVAAVANEVSAAVTVAANEVSAAVTVETDEDPGQGATSTGSLAMTGRQLKLLFFFFAFSVFEICLSVKAT